MTPDALLALLRANPEAAVAAIPQFRVAGPWEFEPGRYGNHRWFRRGVYPVRDVLVVTVVFADAGLVDRVVGVTHEGWWLLDAPPVPFATAEEAKAAADERMADWVLP